MEDRNITRAIVETFTEEWLDHLQVDVAVAGAGPAGLTAAVYLAEWGYKTAVFERKLSTGGGMWGGGMMFNKIVVQEEAVEVLKKMNITCRPYREKGYYTADAVEAAGALAARAVQAGAKVFNLMSVEDLLVRRERVAGVVLNWSSVEMAGLHVDPMSVDAGLVVDATGHDCSVARVITDKIKDKLDIPGGEPKGESSMWAEAGEEAIVRNTGEVYPGLLVAGMAVNAVFGDHRMGPVFGGMFLSGKKTAELIREKLGGDKGSS